MRWKGIRKKVKGSFAAKSFISFTLFTIIIALSLSAFFLRRESSSARESMIKEGLLLARILSQNSRLGIFSGNRGLIEVPLETIFTEPEVLSVAVYDPDGRLLGSRRRTVSREGNNPEGETNDIPGGLPASAAPVTREDDGVLVVWMPVSSASFPSMEGGSSRPSSGGRVIGCVRLAMSKDPYRKELRLLLLNGSLLAAAFLVAGSLIVFFMVRRFTRPLGRLTAGVHALAGGSAAEKVPVETADEIGRLATAFNEMGDALKSREMERDRLEEQLRHAQKMEALGTLSGGIAHDFNNILMIIKGYAELLARDLPPGSPHRTDVEKIISSAVKATNLTRSLTAFSRKQLINLRLMSLNDAVGNARKVMSRLIGEHIETEFVLCREDLVVKADAGQIDQVLINLVTNARDSMPGGGKLTITTEAVELDEGFCAGRPKARPGRHARLSVRDTGTGMDEDTRKKIFDPFFTTKEVGKGTGLGLSIVYGIIKQHGGFVEVETAPGKGSVFSVYLPLAVAGEVPKQPPEEEPAVHGGSETILLAEDDSTLRGLSKIVLQQHGYRVIEALDGRDALEKFRLHAAEIQFLLLDVMMPRMNGMEVYEAIRGEKPDMRALFISGYADDTLGPRGVSERGIPIVYKPVAMPELLKKLREIMDAE